VLKVILFGATGMVGQGVMRECLRDETVESVLSVGRSSSGQAHPKLREIVRSDLFDYAPIESELSGLDACFFCLGVSSTGMTEAAYRRITYDLTLAAAETLARLNPNMTFVFVSGAGTDSTERGRTMWTRVKGATENALLRLPFKAAYMLRPGAIEAMHGITSRTKLYRVFYVVLRPLFVLLRGRLPKYLTTTEQIGRAMLKLAREGGPKRILESEDINRM
jgi:uncharacterized protein YbjT (DUF2867 family)